LLSNGKKLGREAAEAACLPCKLSWSATASTAALAAEAAAVGSRKQPLLVDSSQATQRSFEATVEERNNEDRTAEAVKAARRQQTGTGRRKSSSEKGHNGLSSEVPVAIGERKPSLPSNSLEDRTPAPPTPSPTR